MVSDSSTTLPEVVLAEQAASSIEFIHIPTPGDHYSWRTGSAIMNIVYELTRVHRRHGGATKIIVGYGTNQDYNSGECAEVTFTGLPTRQEKICDILAGAHGLARQAIISRYRPALAAIPADFQGWIFVWNQPGVVELIKDRAPKSRVCLFAVNSVFKTYTPWEASKIAASTDLVLCISQFLADTLRVRLGKHAAKLAVLLPGVDTHAYTPMDRPIEGPKTVLFVGRMQPEKGADILIEAAKKIDLSKLGAKIRIIGSHGFAPSKQLQPFERRVRELAEPLKDFIEFEEAIDRRRLVAEYQKASILCVPSDWDEPCPLVIPEALSCGVPVIASNRGGIPEAGKDAVLYIQSRNVNELAERLEYLLNDDQVWQEMSRKSRTRAEQMDWSIRYKELCESIKG